MEKFQIINKRAGADKAVQVGNFHRLNNLYSTFINYSRVPILGCLPIFKNIFKQNGERPNDFISTKDLKSKISEDLARK